MLSLLLFSRTFIIKIPISGGTRSGPFHSLQMHPIYHKLKDISRLWLLTLMLESPAQPYFLGCRCSRPMKSWSRSGEQKSQKNLTQKTPMFSAMLWCCLEIPKGKISTHTKRYFSLWWSNRWLVSLLFNIWECWEMYPNIWSMILLKPQISSSMSARKLVRKTIWFKLRLVSWHVSLLWWAISNFLRSSKFWKFSLSIKAQSKNTPFWKSSIVCWKISSEKVWSSMLKKSRKFWMVRTQVCLQLQPQFFLESVVKTILRLFLPELRKQCLRCQLNTKEMSWSHWWMF